MQLDKSLGRDLITSFWYKKLYFYRDKLSCIKVRTTVKNVSHLGYQKARTKLLTKNEITDIAKNYRVLA